MASRFATTPKPASQTQQEIDWYAEIDRTNASQDEKDDLKKWIRNSKSKRLEILVTGKTGNGKSNLVNCLVKQKVAKEGHDLEPETKEVRSYTVTTKDHFEIVVWDSPGLQDGTNDEQRYLAELKKRCSNVDLVIYCIKVDVMRSALHHRHDESLDSDLSAIQKLTKTLGVEMWSHAVFVLTFANKLEAILKAKHSKDLESKFVERIENWRTRIREALKSARVPQRVVENVRIEPAGHVKKPHLPGWKFWLSVLWFTLVNRATTNALAAFVQINVDRLKPANDAKEEDFIGESHQQPIFLSEQNLAYAKSTGAIVGGVSAAIVGGVSGAASAGTGAAIGLAIGGMLGSVAPGPGTVIGAVVGAAIGGAIAGASIGLGVTLLRSFWGRKK